jgi:uncharacterized protein
MRLPYLSPLLLILENSVKMLRGRGKAFLLTLLYLASYSFAFFTATAELPVPPFNSYVTDQAVVLNPGERAALEAKLSNFSKESGSQIAVLLVPTTQPEAIEQYAIRVAEAWKIGRKIEDDGILILVAKGDRAVRIEVGHGLEGAVPDAYAKRIIDEAIIPYFKSGDFTGGINSGVDKLIGLIKGEKLPLPPSNNISGADYGGGNFLNVLIFSVIFGNLFAGMLKPFFGSFLASSVAAGGVFFIGCMLLPAILSVIAAVITFIFSSMSGASRGIGRGGWYMGGGGYRGGGFGGGGFSGGGGGSFGGGGASGRW